jgi:hypothetical protein
VYFGLPMRRNAVPPSRGVRLWHLLVVSTKDEGRSMVRNILFAPVVALVVVLGSGCGGVVADRMSDSGVDSATITAMDSTAPDTQASTGVDSSAFSIDSAAPDTDYTADGGVVMDGTLSVARARPGQTACGATVCNAADEVCCVQQDGRATCTDLNGCVGAPFICSGASSCPSTEGCCGSFGAFCGILQSTACGTCTDENPVVCTQNEDCAADEKCVSAGGAGYGICLPPDGGMGC